MRLWRTLIAAGLGMIGIVLLQTQGGRDWQLWQEFLGFAGAFPKGTFFRDNSLHSLVYNTIWHLKWLLGSVSDTVNEPMVSRIVLILMTISSVVYLSRFLRRTQYTVTASWLP